MAVRDLIRREGHLSTPSLGITPVALLREGPFEPFQLPLSGSRIYRTLEFRGAAPDLSTPSLGITRRVGSSLI